MVIKVVITVGRYVWTDLGKDRLGSICIRPL